MYKLLSLYEKRKPNLNYDKISGFVVSEKEIDNDFESLDFMSYNAIILYTEHIKNDYLKIVRNKCSFFNIKIIYITNEEIPKFTQNLQSDFFINENIDQLVEAMTTVKNMLDMAGDYRSDIIHPFKLSIQEIFNMMAFEEISLVDAYRVSSKFHYNNTTGVMALGGTQRGYIMCSLNFKLAKELISKFLAIAPKDLGDDQINDGISEIVNMIAGGTNARIEDDEYHFDLAAPIVLFGDYNVHIQEDVPEVVLVYKIKDQYFAVKISLVFLKK